MGNKQRYYNLFNAVADVIEYLMKAQRETENIYIESNQDDGLTYGQMCESLMEHVENAFNNLERIKTGI